MKPVLISLLAALGVALLSTCLRADRFDMGTLDFDLTWDDLATDLWWKPQVG